MKTQAEIATDVARKVVYEATKHWKHCAERGVIPGIDLWEQVVGNLQDGEAGRVADRAERTSRGWAGFVTKIEKAMIFQCGIYAVLQDDPRGDAARTILMKIHGGWRNWGRGR